VVFTTLDFAVVSKSPLALLTFYNPSYKERINAFILSLNVATSVGYNNAFNISLILAPAPLTPLLEESFNNLTTS